MNTTTSAESTKLAAPATAQPRAPRPIHTASGWLLALLGYPETVAVVLLIAAFAVSASLSPYFLDLHYLLDSTSLYMEVGLMALAMTLVIISGNIDLSVASNLALTGVICAKLFANFGVPMPLAALLGPIIGSMLGLLNGVMITALRLPSLTVTLGTLALYRGLAQVLAGDQSVGHLPSWFVGVDYRYLGPIPLPLALFFGAAVVFGAVLRKTIFGRCVYALGTNELAARFSGLRVVRVKLAVFTLSGLMAGCGAILMMSRLSVARYDLALGEELAVITAVVLGGADILGGRGSIFGTVVALFLLGVIRRGMGVADMSAENQLAVTGSLLIAAVLLARLSATVGDRLREMRNRGEMNHA